LFIKPLNGIDKAAAEKEHQNTRSLVLTFLNLCAAAPFFSIFFWSGT